MDELSLEEQISIALQQPFGETAEKRLCQYEGCGVPLAHANKGKHCFRHSQIVKALKYERDCNKTEVAGGSKTRVCNVMDCDTPVASYSASGRCARHTHLSIGMQLKDGSIPRPRKRHEMPLPPEPVVRERTPVTEETNPPVKTEEDSPVIPKQDSYADSMPDLPDFVSIKVPMRALDMFWARMSTDEKLRIIEREMFGS